MVSSNQNEPVQIRVQSAGQFQEHIQTFTDAPAKGDTQQDLFILGDPIFVSETVILRFKDRQIYAIVDHGNGIILHKRLFHQISKPTGWSHDGQIQPCKQILLFLVQRPASVKEKAMIPILGTVLTTSSPPITVGHHEMRTVGCKRPAIVEGPDQLDFLLLEVTEQHTKMAVMTVDVMQMDQIGLDALQLRYDPFGSLFGVKAIITQHSGFAGLKTDVASVRVTDAQIVAIRLAAVENIVLDSLLSQQLADLHTDLARTADSAGRVDLNDFHNVSYSQKNL